jgi:hypothetical protein
MILGGVCKRASSIDHAVWVSPRVRGDAAGSAQCRQPKPPARHVAFDIAGHANAAHLGTNGVDRARGRHADAAGQRRTAVAVTAHARLSFVDEIRGNEREGGVIFGREARPVLRIGAAGPARLAGAFDAKRWFACFHAAGSSAKRRDRPVGDACSDVARVFPDQASSPFRP